MPMVDQNVELSHFPLSSTWKICPFADIPIVLCLPSGELGSQLSDHVQRCELTPTLHSIAACPSRLAQTLTITMHHRPLIPFLALLFLSHRATSLPAPGNCINRPCPAELSGMVSERMETASEQDASMPDIPDPLIHPPPPFSPPKPDEVPDQGPSRLPHADDWNIPAGAPAPGTNDASGFRASPPSNDDEAHSVAPPAPIHPNDRVLVPAYNWPGPNHETEPRRAPHRLVTSGVFVSEPFTSPHIMHVTFPRPPGLKFHVPYTVKVRQPTNDEVAQRGKPQPDDMPGPSSGSTSLPTRMSLNIDTGNMEPVVSVPVAFHRIDTISYFQEPARVMQSGRAPPGSRFAQLTLNENWGARGVDVFRVLFYVLPGPDGLVPDHVRKEVRFDVLFFEDEVRGRELSWWTDPPPPSPWNHPTPPESVPGDTPMLDSPTGSRDWGMSSDDPDYDPADDESVGSHQVDGMGMDDAPTSMSRD